MSKSSQNQLPKFDFSSVGRRWDKRFSHIMLEIDELSAVLSAPPRDDLTDEETQTLRLGRLEATRRVRGLDDERDALIAEVLKDVPRGMLTPDAPETLDWSTVDAQGYIKEFSAVVQALAEARSAKN